LNVLSFIEFMNCSAFKSKVFKSNIIQTLSYMIEQSESPKGG